MKRLILFITALLFVPQLFAATAICNLPEATAPAADDIVLYQDSACTTGSSKRMTFGNLFNKIPITRTVLIDMAANDILGLDSIFFDEKASADASTAGEGQVWVKNESPATLWFTNDVGVDFQIAATQAAFSDASDPIVQNTTTKNVNFGDGATLIGKVEIGGDADQPQFIIQSYSTQTDDVMIIMTDGDVQVFTVSKTGAVVAAGGVTADVTGALTGNADTATTAGTVTTAAQPAITSVGTLTTLTVDDITINGSVITGATSITSTAFVGALTGNADTVTTNANLTGGVTSVGNAATVITNANLTGGVTSVGNAATVITNANLTGPITSVGNATTITAKSVALSHMGDESVGDMISYDVATGAPKIVRSGDTGEVLTGVTGGVPAFEKIAVTTLANGTDGELITWSNLGVAETVAVGTITHVLTSNGVGQAPSFQPDGAPPYADSTELVSFGEAQRMRIDVGAVAGSTTRVLTMPDNDVDLADVATNSAKVTNATHTGDVTGDTGLTIALDAVGLSHMAAGTAGELITYDASNNPEAVAVGTATHVLTSNGVGVAPTFQAAAAGGPDWVLDAQNVCGGEWACDARTSGDRNIGLGVNVLTDMTEGSDNVVFGDNAGNEITTAEKNILLGSSAGHSLTTSSGSSHNIVLGYYALAEGIQARYNVAIGSQTLDANISGDSNIAIGYTALGSATGSENIAIGHQAMLVNAGGVRNVAIGHKVALSSSGSSNNDNVYIGNNAGEATTAATAGDNTVIGSEACDVMTTGGNNICIGYNSAISGATASNEIVLGNFSNNVFNVPGVGFAVNGTDATLGGTFFMQETTGASTDVPNQGQIWVNMGAPNTLWFTDEDGTDTQLGVGGGGSGPTWVLTDDNMCAGDTACDSLTTGDFNIAIGDTAGTALSSGEKNVFIGVLSGDAATTTKFNVGVGYNTLSAITTTSNSDNNVAIGYNSLALCNGCKSSTFVGAKTGDALTTGDLNTGVGDQVMTVMTDGTRNTGVGTWSQASATGDDNTTIGYNAGAGFLGDRNTGVGSHALEASANTGDNDNTAVGFSAGDSINSGGQGNTLVGAFAAHLMNTADDTVAIGFNACDAITTGNNNICIGADTDPSGGTATNEIILGNSNAALLFVEGVGLTVSPGQMRTDGTTPALTSCGTTPSIGGSDQAGKITIGTGTITSCTATFAVAYANAPACTVGGTGTAYSWSTTTTALVVTHGADMATDVISYVCFGL